eukprot:3563737-Rhodomonas_salina.2
MSAGDRATLIVATVNQHFVLACGVSVYMDRVDCSWWEQCKAVDHAAKLDTRLGKGGRFRDWLSNQLGDAVRVVDTNLENYNS